MFEKEIFEKEIFEKEIRSAREQTGKLISKRPRKKKKKSSEGLGEQAEIISQNEMNIIFSQTGIREKIAENFPPDFPYEFYLRLIELLVFLEIKKQELEIVKGPPFGREESIRKEIQKITGGIKEINLVIGAGHRFFKN